MYLFKKIKQDRMEEQSFFFLKEYKTIY
jgi:hypothetical protein